MTDIVDPATRHRMMASIKGRNTKPEMIVRSGLHRMGYRFRLHAKELPGKPDLVLPRLKAVIEVRGCFWHGHQCPLFRWPGTRTAFWRDKIIANIERDTRNREALLADGWRLAEVWECQLKGRGRKNPDQIIKSLAHFLESDVAFVSLGGVQTVSARDEE